MGTGRGHFGGLGLSSGLRPWRPCGLVGFVLTATKSSLYYRPDLILLGHVNTIDDETFSKIKSVNKNRKTIKILDLGGGIGINYKNEKVLNFNDYAKMILNLSNDLGCKSVS